jgi:hypothetical protein
VVANAVRPDRLIRTAPSWGHYVPRSLLGQVIAHCFPYLPDELADELLERLKACVVVESSLALVHWHGIWSDTPGRRDDHGIVGRKVVTDLGVAHIVDTFDNTLATGDMRYHGLGTGGAAEAVGNTALTTELTTAYNPDSTRATGTFSQPSANVSQSVATNTVDGAAAVTEHGVFAAATGAVTMLDRTLFTVINLASADSLQSTYQLSLASGG